MNERRKQNKCPVCPSEIIFILAEEHDVDGKKILKCRCNDCGHIFLKQRKVDIDKDFWTEEQWRAEWR
jgi:hypothetical protein